MWKRTSWSKWWDQISEECKGAQEANPQLSTPRKNNPETFRRICISYGKHETNDRTKSIDKEERHLEKAQALAMEAGHMLQAMDKKAETACWHNSKKLDVYSSIRR